MPNRGIRYVARCTASLVALLATGTGIAAATHPAAAASVLAQIASAATCSSPSACLAWTNLASGPALWGTSTSGVGAYGKSTSRYGVQGASVTNYGVTGSSTSGPAGTAGTMVDGTGVFGYTSGNSTADIGVEGSAPHGFGLYGTTSGDGFGVFGEASGSGYGVAAESSSGIASYGYSSSGNGGYFRGGAIGLEAVTSSGTAVRAATTSGYGLYVSTGSGLGVLATNLSGNAGDFRGSYLGVIGRTPASGFPFVATDPSGNNLFYVDGAGNMSLHGSVYTFARTAGGGTATAFSPKATLPTLEDTGTAQLVGGASTVRLEPTFAASIDPRTSYRVFLTPNGDTRGLFVAVKTPAGFVVRESQGGRSTVSFDYRIVATALGDAGQRMTLVRGASQLSAPRAMPPAAPADGKVARPPTAQPAHVR